MARVPKMHRHKTGQARVRLAGKDYYLGPWGSAKAEEKYRELVGKFLLEKSDPGGEPKQRQDVITLAELLAAYWEHAKKYYRDPDGKPAKEQVAMADVVKLLRETLPADLLCADFGPLRLKAVRETLVERGLSRPFVNRQIQRAVRIFRFGAESELIPAEVYYGLRSVPGLKRGRTSAPETEPVKPVPLADVDKAAKKMPRRIRAMVELQLASAMRPGEVCIIRPADVDTSGEVWTYRPSRHKNQHRGHERIVPIGPKGQKILRPWLESREPEAFCFSPAEAEAERLAAMRSKRKTKVQTLASKPRQGEAKETAWRAIHDGKLLACDHEGMQDGGNRAVGTEPASAYGGNDHPKRLRLGSEPSLLGAQARGYYANLRRAGFGLGAAGCHGNRLNTSDGDRRE